MEEKRDKLDDWVKKLNDFRMPVFAKTASDISKIVSDRDSSASELARIVLRDAAMSARILRVANSSFHRTGSGSICTVSRAVVKLGYETVRRITMSVSVVEALLKGDKRERVLNEMAHAFHAATQAQSMSKKKNAEFAEDVFVAALLYRIGNMAFWCLPEEQTSKLEKALEENPDADPVEIEKQVLGFSMYQLTSSLSKEWDLGPMLNKALTSTDESDPLVASINLGHKIADAAEKGWEGESLSNLANEIADKLDIAPDEIKDMMQESAGEAVDNARVYGAKIVAGLIPVPGVRADADAEDEGAASIEGLDEQYYESNPDLQQEFLRELAAVVEEKPNINELLSMIIEGIHRGVGMDRALFALLTPDKRYMRAKCALGVDQDMLMEKFVFDMKPQMGNENIFSQQVLIKQALFIPTHPPEKLLRLLPDDLLEITGRNGFYSAPIIVFGNSIGLFYADRSASGRELDQESYDSFKHFSQQASFGIENVARL